MPLYDFHCSACGEDFEARSAPDQAASCPHCGSGETTRVFTPFAGPFTVGLRGGPARRSNAARHEREEQRRERRERRKRAQD